jgi:L-galactose dehydrogenase/L-glyceraldehyde 3-phosphate reductase
VERRQLGRTGLKVSVIGFGCGMVGGLMVGGSAAEQEVAVGSAIDAGINYFDTAPFYGAGRSEENLGRVLQALRQRPIVGTKFRVNPDVGSGRPIAEAVATSVEESLRRLRLDRIDLLQLHNPVSPEGAGGALSVATVLGGISPALQRLIEQGKVRYAGLTGLGHAPSVVELAKSGLFYTAQVSYSLLNPSAAVPLPAASDSEDHGGMLTPLRQANLGVIGIRLLSGGSLSGASERHPTAMSTVIPLGRGPGSGRDYARDVDMACRFDFLVRESLAESLAAAALRYGLSNADIHTMAIGFSSQSHLDEAIRCAAAGAFDAATLDRIARIQQDLGVAAGIGAGPVDQHGGL